MKKESTSDYLKAMFYISLTFFIGSFITAIIFIKALSPLVAYVMMASAFGWLVMILLYYQIREEIKSLLSSSLTKSK